jgi:hydroxyethylthiazole kinase-like sugar kinase family protein
MLFKGTIALCAAVVLAGCFVAATDASAAVRQRHHLLHPALTACSKKLPASQRASHKCNSNFGVSGPYFGLKYVGNS